MTKPILGRAIFYERTWPFLIEILIFGAGLAFFYGLLVIAETWIGPFRPAAVISQSPLSLPVYAANSLLRIITAYLLSLLFTLVYGYTAAYHAKAEQIMIPLLDILQSIPVLSFLPGVMLAMVALFPHSQFGVELGAILLIFTGQVWNMTFSFYTSLKSIPQELREAANVYRFSGWQRFTQLELPYAAIGLVWNSMMSVAGGWFFLMACEMFVLGERDFRLPGLGSYLQTAASTGDTTAILWGLGAMIGVIILLDLVIWRPVIAWAEKFKLEQVESASVPRSAVLYLLRRSVMVTTLKRKVFTPLGERMGLHFARSVDSTKQPQAPPAWRIWRDWAVMLTLALVVGYALERAGAVVAGLNSFEIAEIMHGAAMTLMRVTVSLLIGAAWTIPAGVAIGLNPRLARVAQPLVQIAASVPATALFPVVLLVLIQAGGGLGIGSILLMLLGTQWYILFNVIAGAMAIPTDLKEAASISRLSTIDRWRLLILPSIFPYLITGLVTAAGGAWNASIVAEYFHFKGRILMTTGLGATISQATDKGHFALLLAATIVMSTMVVMINRLVWRKLYRLAETRFKMET